MQHNQQSYQVTERHQLAPHIVSYTLTPCGSPLRTQPGQYVLWHLLDQTIHCSVAKQTPTGVLYVHLRENAHNGLLSSIIVNETYVLEGPFGHCVIQTPIASPLILVAGGTGYAPYHALIPHILEQRLSSQVYFYWGVQRKEDWYAWDTLYAQAQAHPHFEFIPVLSNPTAAWDGRTGFVHEAVLEDFPSLSETIVFASGPWPMIQTLSHQFTACGLLEESLFSDFLPRS